MAKRGYFRPKVAVVDVNVDDMLQGIVDVSGETGPSVDPDHPVDPDGPGSELSNVSSVWDNG